MLKPTFAYPLLLDVDDVLLDLLTVWLDELTKFDIKSWNIDKYVKPECGTKIFDYLDTDLYWAVKPIEGAVAGVNWLRENNIPFIFATVYDPDGSKFKCLKEHGFTSNRKEYFVCPRKSLLRGSMMIDDKPEHVYEFGHRAWLFSQPHNEAFEWPERVDTWAEIISKMGQVFKIGV
jgi:5'(3')-deoxyribonucleotidase